MSRRRNKPVRAAEPLAGQATRLRVSGRESLKAAAISFGIVTLVAAVFAQTRRFPFINVDDSDYVFRNPMVTGGLTLEGIRWAFTHVYSANWHPLTWLSHMADCELYGLQPGGHHVTNVLLHGATAILLFLFLRDVTGALWRSGFASALFAIHPLRVESVAWVAERKDVLSGLFFVLTLWAYVRYVRGPAVRRYLLVVFVFALGLMSKPMLVTLPLILLLLDFWPLNRLKTSSPGRTTGTAISKLVAEKLPLLALSMASCVITIVAQHRALQSVGGISLATRGANALVSCAEYLRTLVWPVGLAAHYPFNVDRLAAGTVALSITLLAAISLAVITGRKRGYLVTGWLWYLIMLAPVIGLVQVGIQARADRYTYLPHIGIYLMIAWAAGDLAARWRPARFVIVAIAVLSISALALAARALTSTWQNSETLWRHALAVTGKNAAAEQNLGEALYEERQLDQAKAHYENALRIDPNLATAHVALGVLLLETGRPAESRAELERALQIDPNNGDGHYNLGNTLLQMRLAPQAVAHYSRAVELNPIDVEAANNLAWVLATSSDPALRDGAQAVRLMERADSLTKHRSNIVTATLAAAYAEAGRFDEATIVADRAIQLASAEGNEARAEAIRVQRESYRTRQPYHEAR